MDERRKRANNEERDEGRRNRIARAIAYAICAVFLVAAVVFFVVCFTLGKDIFFIPAALCLVVAMLAFTFAKTRPTL